MADKKNFIKNFLDDAAAEALLEARENLETRSREVSNLSLALRHVTSECSDLRKEPRKFFDLAESNHTIEACILKIHRSEAYCNKLLSENNAKAIVSTRDYYSIAASFARMKNNKHSPFYSPKTLDDNQLIQFINYEISEHRKKQSLPNTLFIREDNIRNRPHEAIQSIANHMGIELSATSATSIGKNLSIESQKARQKSIIINSTGHDHECFMHHTHIKEEEKEYDTKYQDLVNTHFGDQLDEAGYLQ